LALNILQLIKEKFIFEAKEKTVKIINVSPTWEITFFEGK